MGGFHRLSHASSPAGELLSGRRWRQNPPKNRSRRAIPRRRHALSHQRRKVNADACGIGRNADAARPPRSAAAGCMSRARNMNESGSGSLTAILPGSASVKTRNLEFLRMLGWLSRGSSVFVDEFLRRRAVNITVGGNYTLSNWYDSTGKPRTFACRTRRVSPFRMIVDVPVVGRIGDRIASYFGDFGSLEGRITDTISGGFLLELEMTKAMRAKLADQLSWLEKRQADPSVRDVREQARIVPANPHACLTFADGTTRNCFVIDISVSGAAVSADVQPPIGTALALGVCVGRVVRHLHDGFALKFADLQRRGELERRVASRVKPAVAGDPVPPQPDNDSGRYFEV
jgi:hypothetical protein